MTDETKTYEILLTDGSRQRITIPATWKVSFGAIVPASAKATAVGYGGAGWGLRIWEATDKQRAVYSGVVEFFDISIPTQVRAVRKFGNSDTDWWLDDGSWTGKRADLIERKWVDADQIVPQPPEETVAKPVSEDEDVWGGSAKALMIPRRR